MLRCKHTHLSETRTKIPDTPKNDGEEIVGERLTGPQILEVPVQNGPVPQVVLDKAADLDIIIRDVHGTEYR